MKKAMILIPALDPPEGLIRYVEELIGCGFDAILVVDDGSAAPYAGIFRQLSRYPQCRVIRHGVNLGKGRALKNGMNYFLTHPGFRDYCGIITVDSDGQHSTADVVRIHAALDGHPGALVLGCRDFNMAQVPPKSRLGNKLTRQLFRFLHGRRISDTQTGLRGISADILPAFIGLDGERFQYETGMLIAAVRRHIPIVEVTIQTIYFDGNAATHFNPLRDSLAIYRLLFGRFFRYSASSGLSAAVELILFQILITIGGLMPAGIRIITATVAARLVSSLANFIFNHRLVFRCRTGLPSAAARYYLPVAVQMLCSAGLVTLLYTITPIPELYLKLIVDTLLFFLSYYLQHNYIFRSRS